jgi:DNA-directed RNA polymerase sigma subunit (sigma70/sigma32)
MSFKDTPRTRPLTRSMLEAVAAPYPVNLKITTRQADVISKVLGIDCEKESFDQIARANGVSASTVKRIYMNGCHILRKLYPDVTIDKRS